MGKVGCWRLCGLANARFQVLVGVDIVKGTCAPSLCDANVLPPLAWPQNYYRALGVAREATVAAIKAAYRKKALEWHPEKHSDDDDEREAAKQTFALIAEAYTVLSNGMHTHCTFTWVNTPSPLCACSPPQGHI